VIAPENGRPQDETMALAEMEKQGARFVTSDQLRTAA